MLQHPDTSGLSEDERARRVAKRMRQLHGARAHQETYRAAGMKRPNSDDAHVWFEAARLLLLSDRRRAGVSATRGWK